MSSFKDRLAKKTEGLLVPGKPGTSTTTTLKTGPGQMLMVNSLMKETNGRVTALEARLKEYEGSLPARMIPADQIVQSKWANRIEESFASVPFAELKEEIAQANGNVQPIKVRATEDGRYEIVFGHRRHRACLELGLDVFAVVDSVDDRELFKEMDRENRSRADLSPWEQGLMYKRALDQKLFSSLGELASELGVDKGNVSKAVRLAELPEEVVKAFASPLDLQYRWAKPLADAVSTDRDGVVKRASEVAALLPRPSARDAFSALLGSEPSEPPVQDKAAIQINAQGEIVLTFLDGAATEAQLEQVRALLSKHFSF